MSAVNNGKQMLANTTAHVIKPTKSRLKKKNPDR